MKRTLARAKLWLINNEEEPIIGEGKAALLEAINREGSLNQACKKMQISYKHAWLLLKEIEESVGEPIIMTQRRCPGAGNIPGNEISQFYDLLLLTFKIPDKLVTSNNCVLSFVSSLNYS